MTINQTRQLGIEFERRVQTMIPETEYAEKLDTDTIYSYLNQYQDMFIRDIYKSLGAIAQQQHPSEYIETILQTFLSYFAMNLENVDNQYQAKLPSNFGLYVDSSTRVSSSYRMKTNAEDTSGVVSNVFVSQTVAQQFLMQPSDSMRIIRNPIVYLDTNSRIKLICDRYTNPTTIGLHYYRMPKYMNLMESVPCELPMEVFETLVSGAVDLYVQYVAGAEARKRQIAEQQKQNAKNEQ